MKTYKCDACGRRVKLGVNKAFLPHVDSSGRLCQGSGDYPRTMPTKSELDEIRKEAEEIARPIWAEFDKQQKKLAKKTKKK